MKICRPLHAYTCGVLAAGLAMTLFAACENPFAGDTPDTPEQHPCDQVACLLPDVPDHLVNRTMYQFFYWDAYPWLWHALGNPHTRLYAKAERLAAAGVNAAWLPPAAKGMGGTHSVGYDTYDLWDLGEFEQKGTTRTRYGTRAELEDALAALEALGVAAYYDVIFNHRMGADGREYVEGFDSVWTYFALEGRQAHYTAETWGNLHHDFEWNWEAFNSVDGELFPGKDWGNVYHFPYLMGNDVDYNRVDILDEVKAWGEWIVNEIGFAGFRMDAIAHVDSDFTREWVNHVQDATGREVVFIAEAWVGNVREYLDHVGAPDLDAFDFALRNDFVRLSRGNKDMRSWGGLVNSVYGERAVTFVDNHDTSRRGNPYNMPQVANFKNQAYAYILLHERGVPTVYARDYDEFEMAPTLDRLIEARRLFAYGPGHVHTWNTREVYAYIREGLPEVPGSGLVMLIAGRDTGGQDVLRINARQPSTTFYDYTRNLAGTVTTDEEGYGDFPVALTEDTGWSVWVPLRTADG